MARNEADKEDLMVEATALVERAEFQCDRDNCETSGHEFVTAGFKRDGSLSLYFDQDPFYQFDATGLLRRSFEAGYLYRSEGSTLAKIHRERTPQQTTLVRTDLSSDELLEFQNRMKCHIVGFRDDLQDNRVTQSRIVCDHSGFREQLLDSLNQILARKETFLAPAIRST